MYDDDDEGDTNVEAARAFTAAAKALGSLVQTCSVSWRYGGKKVGKLYKVPGKLGIFTIYNAVPTVYEASLTDGAAIAQFASDMVPYRGHAITASEDLRKVLSRSMHRPKLVLFTQKKTVPLVFKLLSNIFAGQVDLCVHLNATRADVPVGPRTLPALVVFTTSGHQQVPTRYEGPSKSEPISKHLNELIALKGDVIGVSGPSTIKRFLLKNPTEPKLMLLCKGTSIPLEFRALSQEFHNTSVSFAVIFNSTERVEWMSKHHLWQVPDIAFFVNGWAKPNMMPMTSIKLISVLLGHLLQEAPIVVTPGEATNGPNDGQADPDDLASASPDETIERARQLAQRMREEGQIAEAEQIEVMIQQFEAKTNTAASESRSDPDPDPAPPPPRKKKTGGDEPFSETLRKAKELVKSMRAKGSDEEADALELKIAQLEATQDGEEEDDDDE